MNKTFYWEGTMSKNNKGLGGCDQDLNSQGGLLNEDGAETCYELTPVDVCGRPIPPSVFKYDRLDFTTVADGPNYQEILQSQKGKTTVTFMNHNGLKFTGMVIMIDFVICNQRGADWISLAIALGEKIIALFPYNTDVKIGGEIKILTDENENV